MENQRQMLANAALERTAALQTELYRTLRGRPVTPENILLAAHSYDVDYRPLSTYTYQSIRYLHILGANPPENFTPAPPDRPSFSPWV